MVFYVPTTTLLVVIILTYTFFADRTIVETVRTILFLALFFSAISCAFLVRLIDFNFPEAKVFTDKIDKISIEKDNSILYLCLFCTFETNRNRLFIVGSQGHIILFQCIFPQFHIKYCSLSGYSSGQNLLAITMYIASFID